MSTSKVNDSEELRKTFSDSKDQIADGWEILASGDNGGSYETDLLMILRGPDGKLYEQGASCCSCYGIEDQWGPIPTEAKVILAEWEKEQERKKTADNYYCHFSEHHRARQEALVKLGVLKPEDIQ